MKLKIAFEIQKSECNTENNLIKILINEEIEKEFSKFYKNFNYNYNFNYNKENFKFINDFFYCLNKSTNFIEFKSKKNLI